MVIVATATTEGLFRGDEQSLLMPPDRLRPTIDGVTPEQIELVQATLAALRPRLDEVAAGLYDRLFGGHPELRALFPGDALAQRSKFAAELDAIVSCIGEHPDFRAAGGDLGRRHRRYGVRPAHHRILGTALLGALASALGDGWTPAVEEAWRLAHNLTAETMMGGAAEATSRERYRD